MIQFYVKLYTFNQLWVVSIAEQEWCESVHEKGNFSVMQTILDFWAYRMHPGSLENIQRGGPSFAPPRQLRLSQAHGDDRLYPADWNMSRRGQCHLKKKNVGLKELLSSNSSNGDDIQMSVPRGEILRRWILQTAFWMTLTRYKAKQSLSVRPLSLVISTFEPLQWRIDSSLERNWLVIRHVVIWHHSVIVDSAARPKISGAGKMRRMDDKITLETDFFLSLFTICTMLTFSNFAFLQ